MDIRRFSGLQWTSMASSQQRCPIASELLRVPDKLINIEKDVQNMSEAERGEFLRPECNYVFMIAFFQASPQLFWAPPLPITAIGGNNRKKASKRFLINDRCCRCSSSSYLAGITENEKMNATKTPRGTIRIALIAQRGRQRDSCRQRNSFLPHRASVWLTTLILYEFSGFSAHFYLHKSFNFNPSVLLLRKALVSEPWRVKPFYGSLLSSNWSAPKDDFMLPKFGQ